MGRLSLTLAPSRITDLGHPDAVNVINKQFNSIQNALSNLAASTVVKRMSGTPLLNFGTIAGNASGDLTAKVPGASASLVATANPLLDLGSTNLTWTAFVSGADTVTIRVTNPTTSPIAVNTVKWNLLVH